MEGPRKPGDGNSNGPTWSPARHGGEQLGPLFTDKPVPDRPFRLPTGEHVPLEAHARQVSDGTPPVVASRRGERGAQIAADVRRIIFFACILFGVAVVLALFVSELLPRSS
jgi:hypothetical protein